MLTQLETYADKDKRNNIAIVMVDAATRSIHDMDLSNKEPSAIGTISAVTGLQLTRYDADSMRLVKEKMKEARELLRNNVEFQQLLTDIENQ